MRRGDDSAWISLFEGLDRSGGQFLQTQLRRRLVAAIASGRLQRDVQLPSSRRLATLLGIGRNTVSLAYQQLLDERILVARDRSGVFVAVDRHAADAPSLAEAESGRGGDWQPRLAMRPSGFRHIRKPRNWTQYPYPFLFGQFDATLFPLNDWRESVRVASSAHEINEWSADMIDEDDADLVAEICNKILPRRGIWASPEEVTITLGAQQALYMVARLVAGPNSRIGIEDPCYPDLRNMLAIDGILPVHLRMDRRGALPDEVFSDCDAVFLTPNHQCPTTVSMDMPRREALLAAAARSGTMVVEDDYEADLFAEGEERPALKSLDADGHVIYVGSLSKALAPGLRLGFTVSRRDIAEELRALRRVMLRHPPANNQRAMAMFISLGHHRSHLRRISAVLADRAARLERRLDELPKSFTWRRGSGATSFWISGPPSFDARAMAALAAKKGVLVEAGDIFFAEPADGRAAFRLGFAAIRAAEIDRGLDHLFAAIRQVVHSDSQP